MRPIRKLLPVAFVMNVCSSLFTGCATLEQANTPMATVWHRDEAAGHRNLIVFLPGIRDTPDDFVRHDWIAAARRAAVPADMVAVGAMFAHYKFRTLLTRLDEDVMNPARSMGYERLIFAGVSLGGMGSILYAQHRPEAVAGLVVVAPYLGESKDVAPIAAAGGLRQWRPRNGDAIVQLWTWLRGYADHEARSPLLLAFGSEDKFARQQSLLAAALPDEQVIRRPGLHRWRVWRSLWEEVLNHETFWRRTLN